MKVSLHSGRPSTDFWGMAFPVVAADARSRVEHPEQVIRSFGVVISVELAFSRIGSESLCIDGNGTHERRQ